MHVYLGFKDQKLVTVVYSVLDEIESAIDMDSYVADPQEAEMQFARWKQEHP